MNVADQRRDPNSLLNWTERVIRTRKECPEISWGDFTVLRTNAPSVLALRYDWRDTALMTLHNFSDSDVKVQLKVGCSRDDVLVELFDGRHSRLRNDAGGAGYVCTERDDGAVGDGGVLDADQPVVERVNR